MHSCTETVNIKFDKYPFFIGPRDKFVSVDLANFLPFELTIHPQYAIPQLVASDEIDRAIQNAYKMGSMISTPLGSSSLSNARLYDFRDQILELLGNVTGKRLLEIGCGTGTLLNEFKKLGANVVGCEIGPQAQKARDCFNLEILQEPIHADLDIQKFDCIYSYGVLEHIKELDTFFSACRHLLKDRGLFFHSFPNSKLSFENCRIEDLFHEHVNYFSEENGLRLFNAQGMRNTGIKYNPAKNEIRLYGFFSDQEKTYWPGSNLEILLDETKRFSIQAKKILANLNTKKEILAAWLKSGKKIGFYAGGYVLSALVDQTKSIRFYDGDSFKHGLFWLADQNEILSPIALMKDPVDYLVICPEHYAKDILKYLKEDIKIPESIKIVRYTDLNEIFA